MTRRPPPALARIALSRVAPVVVGVLLRCIVAAATLVMPARFVLDQEAASAQVGPSTVAERALDRPRLTPFTIDERAYDELARSLVAGQGMRTEHDWVVARAGTSTSYGDAAYPLLGAAVYAVSGGSFAALVLVQIALAGTLIATLGAAARRLWGERAGAGAAWIAALHPGLLLTSSLMMTEALATVVTAWTIWIGLRWRERESLGWAFAFGAALGLGLLVRSPTGVIGACFALALAFWRPAVPRPALRLLPVALAAALVVAPWAIRNARVHGDLVLGDTKAGATFWNFNHPGQSVTWDAQSIPADPLPRPIDGLSEPQASRAGRARSLAYVRDEPATFVGVSTIRAVQYWWPVPKRIASATTLFGVAGYALLTLLAWVGLAGIWSRRNAQPAALAVLAAVGAGWVIAALVAAGLRQRLSVEDFVVLAAAAGGAALLDRWLPAEPHISTMAASEPMSVSRA